MLKPENTADAGLKALLEQEPARVYPGTKRYKELQAQADQQGIRDNLNAGYLGSALSTASRLLEEEAAPLSRTIAPASFADTADASSSGYFRGVLDNALRGLAGIEAATRVLGFGERAGGVEDYFDANYDRLAKDIPAQFHEEIFGSDNLAAAERARARILQQMERGRRNANQSGLSRNLAMMVGGLMDIDLPLMLVTGGGFKAATVAGKAMRASRNLGLSTRASTEVARLAVGANAGLQAGGLVGAADAKWSETRTWTAIADTAMTSMILGGVGNVLLRGSALSSVERTRNDLRDRISRDDSSLDAEPDILASNASPLDLGARQRTSEETVESTVGAEGTPQPGVRRTVLNDPAGEVSTRTRDIVDQSSDWRHSSGWLDRKTETEDDFWTKVALSAPFNLSTDNFRKLYTSDAAVANWIAGNVFESTNGLGRGNLTAGAAMEPYQRRIMSPVRRVYTDLIFRYARQKDKTWLGSKYGITQDGVRSFNRELYLEMNAIRYGTQRTENPIIREAAEQYQKAADISFSIGRGREGQNAIDGFEDIVHRPGYLPQVWSGRRILDIRASGRVNDTAIRDAIASGYQRSGVTSASDAEKIASAILSRAISREIDIDTNLSSLMTSDGRQFLRRALRDNGVPEVDTESIMKRMTGLEENARKEGFVKKRADIDWNQNIETLDGSDLKIVDLLEEDLALVWGRYARRMAGSASLARVGITNRAQVEDLITAMHSEQRSLGEDVIEGDLIRAMFSHFNGGPVHGYSRGMTNKGQADAVVVAKRMTGLSLLGKMGFAQAAEMGTMIAANGLSNWWNRGLRSIINKDLKDRNAELLDDLAFTTGDLGFDHHLMMEWVNLDDVSRGDRRDWLSGVMKLTAQGQFIQAYTSLFNTVRSFQQRVSTMGRVDRIMRDIRLHMELGEELPERVSRRLWNDLGLDGEDIGRIERLIENGTIEFSEVSGHTFVNRVNLQEWDVDLLEHFGAAMNRNMSQQVQRSLPGEQDAWINTEWGTIMTQFKTFPLQAMQKQFIRNMRHSDMETLNVVLASAATAMIALAVRDALDGKERDVEDLARASFSYSNMTGWVPMVYDPVMTLLGFEDSRINPYGPYSDYTPPVIDTINRGGRLAGAIYDTATGEDDFHDRQSIRALPFTNTIGLSRVLD